MLTEDVEAETEEVEQEDTALPSTPAPTPVLRAKTQTMPTEAIGRLKREARERGKREAMGLLEEQAKAAGFSSLADAFQAMADSKKVAAAAPTPAAQEAKPAAAPSKNQDLRWQRELDRREKALQEAQRKLRLEEKRRKEIQRTMDQREVEQTIREQAILAGIHDVDFAVELARREARQIVDSVPADKVEEALRQFDERKFFNDLRGKRPYLFGEKVVQATTGTGIDAAAAGTPPAPTPAKVTDTAAKSDQVDARKMSRDEFTTRLQALGLNPQAV